MTEHHDTTPESTSGWRNRAGAITRAVAATAVGTGYGYATHDVGHGLTAAGVALGLLRDVFMSPPR